MNTQKVRNYMVSGALFMAAAVVSATDYTVSKSGNWSDASIWSDGEVPSTTVSDNVIFGADNITLTVDGSGKTSVGTLNFGSYNATIDIASGSTLHLDKKDSLGVAAGKKLTFNGDGMLELRGAAWNVVSTASTLEFNTDVSIVTSQGHFSAAAVTFNKGFTAANNVIFHGNSYVDFHGNINVAQQFNMYGSSTARASVFHADSVVKVGTGSSGGIILRTAKVFGSIEVNKNRENNTSLLGYDGGTTVFEEGSSFVQQNSGTTDSFIGNVVERGKLQIKAGVKNFDLEKDLRIRGTLQLGASNLITIGGKAQGEASFDICAVDRAEAHKHLISSKTSKIILDADNDFGKFNFYGDSVLTIVANGFASTIGGFGTVDTESYSYTTTSGSTVNVVGATGSVTLKITESEDFKIFIKGGKKADGTADIANIESYLDNTDVRTSNIFVDGQEAFLIYNEEKGGWYVNSSAAVPEPATVATIFGLFALGFVAYRKRRC